MSLKKILVIRFSALGDIIQSFPAFQAIRQHHLEDHITIMTTPLYRDLLKQSKLCDEVWEHSRLRLHEIGAVLAFRRQFLAAGFNRVYDLQLSQRSTLYYKLIGGQRSGIEWVGRAKRGAVQFVEPRSLSVNTFDRHQALLSVFGMRLQKSDLRGLATPLAIELPQNYAVIVPGASHAFDGAKKWPQSHYVTLCDYLVSQQITPIIVGGPEEDNRIIAQLSPNVLDLTGQTRLSDIITLAKDARLVVGNDTGPMHVAVASRARVLILFSGKTHPEKVLTKEANINWLQAENIADLSPDIVIGQVSCLLND